LLLAVVCFTSVLYLIGIPCQVLESKILENSPRSHMFSWHRTKKQPSTAASLRS